MLAPIEAVLPVAFPENLELDSWWLFPVVPRSPVAVGGTVFSTPTVDTDDWALLTLLTFVVVLSVNPAHVCSMVMIITCSAIIIIWALPSPV